MSHGSRPAQECDSPGPEQPPPRCDACAARAAAIESCAHEVEQCLTAIRNYAAGARHAADRGEREKLACALLSIDRQIARAHALLAAARPGWREPLRHRALPSGGDGAGPAA